MKIKFILNKQQPYRALFNINKNPSFRANFIYSLTPTKLSQLDNDVGFLKKEDLINELIEMNNVIYKEI